MDNKPRGAHLDGKRTERVGKPRPAIAYLDMPWALDAEGNVDAERATIERAILGEQYELRFAPAANFRYAEHSPVVRELLAGVSGLVVNRRVITEELLEAAGPALRVVCRQGVGYDNLSPALLEARGVIGVNVPDYCIDEVAAHTLALVLALERRIIPQHQTLVGGRFDIYAGGVPRRIREQTAGIVGFGRIGRVVADRLRTFYGHVVATDPNVNDDVMAAHGVRKVGLDELLANADLITLHCQLHDGTYHLLDADAFRLLKPTTFLVNAARGALIAPNALLSALLDNRLAGAGLDVFDPEDPHQDRVWSEILKLPSVLVTSHRAFLSTRSAISQRQRASEALEHVLSTGRPPVAGHVRSETHPTLTARTSPETDEGRPANVQTRSQVLVG